MYKWKEAVHVYMCVRTQGRWSVMADREGGREKGEKGEKGRGMRGAKRGERAKERRRKRGPKPYITQTHPPARTLATCALYLAQLLPT